MADSNARGLTAILEEIRAREPLFHRRELVYSALTFDQETSDDYWEIGASGRRYSRALIRRVILERLATKDQDEFVTEGWWTDKHHLRPLSEDVYLFTYVLHGQSRVTRRSTVWRHTPDRGWHALYHQGTIVHDV